MGVVAPARRRRRVRGLAGVAAALLGAMLLPACSAIQQGASGGAADMPVPIMVTLYDSNRMVWLSREDDDQIPVARHVWDAALAARPVTGSEVSTETIAVLKYSGRAAFVDFMDPVSAGVLDEAVSLVLVLEPGETGLAAGDIVTATRPDPYRVVGEATEEGLTGARAVIEKRMGLR